MIVDGTGVQKSKKVELDWKKKEDKIRGKKCK